MSADVDSLAFQELQALEELAVLRAKLARLKEKQNLPKIIQWREHARPEQLPPGGNWRTWYVRGGRGCIAPGTRIWLPLEGRHERVDVLAATGKPAAVLALTGDGPRPVVTGGAPFLKGIADLYEVTTEDGQVITVTDRHRFLTPGGWKPLATLRAGNVLRRAEDADIARWAVPQWTMVEGITPAGAGEFYDLTVPGAENYAAEGLWHHNSGKTWTASHAFAEWILTDPEPGEWGIVAPTYQDAWSVCMEGESGLLAAFGTTYPEVRAGEAELVEHWHRSFAEMRLRSGHIIRVASAEDGALHIQGKNLKGLWGDEVGLWDRWQIVWEESIRYAVRKGSARIILTGTPKKSRAARKLVRLLLDDPDIPVSRLRTADNEQNLSAQFFAEVVGKSKGTRLERQELEGDLLADVEGALWTPEVIDASRVTRAPDLVRVVIAIDPAVTSKAGSDETGIIVAGDAGDGHGYVIADYSMRGTPDACMKKAVWAYKEHNADRIVGEANNGGDYLGALLRTVAADVPYKKVIATRGKAIRAEPVSALYEQKRIHHVGIFSDLEDQLCTWLPTDSESPDRLDALTWAFTELRGLSAGSWHEAYGTAICSSEKCGRGFMKNNPDGTERTHCPHCRAPVETGDDDAAEDGSPEESAV